MGFKNYNVERKKKKEEMISPRIELGTFCVLSRCHNRLDHETNFLVFATWQGDQTKRVWAHT